MRNDRWDRKFIDLAIFVAEWSKDPSTKVGAVIVGPDNDVRSLGFNGFPRGIEDSAERLNDRDTKLKLIVHAEMNAILNASRFGVPLKGCTMYIAATDSTGAIWGGSACVRCTVEIIQSGIDCIVSIPQKNVPSRWHEDLKMAHTLLREAGIAYHEHDLEKEI